MNTYLIQNIINKHNTSYSNFWNEILDENQKQIDSTIDYNDRQILQATQNKIITFINEQSNMIEVLCKQLASSPTVEQVNYLKRYNSAAKAYIRNLGGNPSNLTFIKESDYAS
jgi:sensor domain CHASE-containing protein